MNKFKVGDKVRVAADEERLIALCIPERLKLTGVEGKIQDIVSKSIGVDFGPEYEGSWSFKKQDLELVENPTKANHTARTFVGHSDGGLEAVTESPIRTFKTGATRDTDQGKLDYVKALSPIVLRRYVQYLDKHRLQPDGSYRDFDNWKQGMPQEAYISGGGRHFVDTWLLTEGYATEDNHGPVELQDALCAQLFNIMGRLHEILKVKTITTRLGEVAQCERS